MKDNEYWSFCLAESFDRHKLYINNMCSGALPPVKTLDELFNNFATLRDLQNRKFVFINFEIPDNDLEKVLKLEEEENPTLILLQAFEVSRIMPDDDLDPIS